MKGNWKMLFLQIELMFSIEKVIIRIMMKDNGPRL
jgi:hypothetical protein